MATFDDLKSIIIPKLFADEGTQYECVKDDRGGETKYGITWVIIKECVEDKIFVKSVLDDKDFIKNLTAKQAEIAYKNCFWDKLSLNKIIYSDVSEKIFNLAILMGRYGATLCAQRAYRSVSGKKLKEDGIMGSKTINAINECFNKIFLASFRSECAGRMRLIQQADKTQQKFTGWLTRAYR